MKTLKKLNRWANTHSSNYVFDLIRWFFGVYIIYKGITFMSNTTILLDLINPENESATMLLLVHSVILTHLCGGILILFGLLTRIASLAQVPILIGAVAINFTEAMIPSNLLEASLVLLFSLTFVIVGSGKHSVDYSLKLEM